MLCLAPYAKSVCPEAYQEGPQIQEWVPQCALVIHRIPLYLTQGRVTGPLPNSSSNTWTIGSHQLVGFTFHITSFPRYSSVVGFHLVSTWCCNLAGDSLGDTFTFSIIPNMLHTRRQQEFIQECVKRNWILREMQLGLEWDKTLKYSNERWLARVLWAAAALTPATRLFLGIFAKRFIIFTLIAIVQFTLNNLVS